MGGGLGGEGLEWSAVVVIVWLEEDLVIWKEGREGWRWVVEDVVWSCWWWRGERRTEGLG